MAAAVQNGASLVKSASVSSLGHLCKQYRAQPFTARLPTLHADKPSDGLGPDPTPNSLDANTCEHPRFVSLHALFPPCM